MEWEGVFVSVEANPNHPFAWPQRAFCCTEAGSHSSRQCKVAFLSRRASDSSQVEFGIL
jgi:hypothetical protein